MSTAALPSVLDPAQALFLAGPVAINAASRSPALVPSVARAYGCRVGADRRTVTLFLAEARAGAMLRDLEEGGPIAAIFSRPKTHVSLQLKGERAEILPVTAADRQLMLAYSATFATEIMALGYAADFAQAMVRGCGEAAVGVRFIVGTAFEQTPGPRAGERLGSGA